jgi:hypothetical protein
LLFTARLSQLQFSQLNLNAGYGGEPTKSDHLGEKEYSPYLPQGYPQAKSTQKFTRFSSQLTLLFDN